MCFGLEGPLARLPAPLPSAAPAPSIWKNSDLCRQRVTRSEEAVQLLGHWHLWACP